MRKSIRYSMLVMTVVLIVCMMPAAVFAKATTHILVTSKTYYDVIDGEARENGYFTYTYDTKGHMIKSETAYRYDGTMEDDIFVTTYEFNKKGLVTQSISTANGENRSKSEYVYKKGKMSRITDYSWEDEWVNAGYSTYKNSAKKTVIKHYDYNKKLKSTTTYYYDKKGRETKHTVKYADGYRNTVKYQYNKKGQITKCTDISVYPNGSKDTYSSVYKYDKYGRIKKENYKDSDGYKYTQTYKYKGSFKKNKSYPKEQIVYIGKDKVSRTVYQYKSFKY